MIFEPEYGGVCSCRIVRAASLNTIDWPSGDQLRPPISWLSARTTSDSRPSASVRTMRSPPLAAAPRLPRPDAAGAGAPGAGAASGRTNATRVPSGDGVMLDSACGVDHTAAGSPPPSATCQRSPWRGKYTRWLSALQNTPAPSPSAKRVSARAPARPEGGAASASATKMLAMPARSDKKATCRPSGDHTALDGWRMSINCSIVSPRASRGCGRWAASTMNTVTARAKAMARKDFITDAVYDATTEPHQNEHTLSNFSNPIPGSSRNS